MLMEVVVRIDVIQRKTGGKKEGELGTHFPLYLLLQARLKKNARANHCRVTMETTINTDQIGNLVRWQRRASIHQHQMQSNPECGHSAGSLDGIRRRRRCHHQTGTGQDAVSVRILYGFIDWQRQTKIVSCADQLLQGSVSFTGCNTRANRSRRTLMPPHSTAPTVLWLYLITVVPSL